MDSGIIMVLRKYLVIFLLFCVGAFCYTKKERSSSLAFAYPDFAHMLSPTVYKGKVFRLSDDYPTSLPRKDKAIKEILSIDYEDDWEQYSLAIRDYIFEGNIDQDGDYENDFFAENNDERDWYHVPWLHWGARGREGFHGLTAEVTVGKQLLAREQVEPTQAYALAMYNDIAAYTIGKIWPPEGGVPNIHALEKGVSFDEGAVIAKILLIKLGEEQVPYLTDPITWKGYVAEGNEFPTEQSVRKVFDLHVVQLDFMIKDRRAVNAGGWVMGTLVYLGDKGNDNRWYNLTPLGIIFGNDPDQKISFVNKELKKTIINKNLEETIINPEFEDIPMHLGWGGRLSGPLDSEISSCVSCHQTAQFPSVSAILPTLSIPPIALPKNGEEASLPWLRYYRNLPSGVSFDKGTANLDFSLRLSLSISNYYEYLSQTQQGIYAENYPGDRYEIIRTSLRQSKK